MIGYLRLSETDITDRDSVEISVDVVNTGNVAGKEIVELYVRDIASSVPRPVKELKGFAKVACAPGERATVRFTLDKRSFAYYEPRISDWYAESGEYEILIGASSRDIRAAAKVCLTSTQTVAKKYDRFVTMGEIMASPAARAVMERTMGGMQMPAPSEEEKRRLLDEEDDTDVAMDYAAMGMDMPLCKVADMTEGIWTEERMEEILAALNGEQK